MVESGHYVAACRRFDQRLISGELGGPDLALGYHLASVAQYKLGNIHVARNYAARAAELAGEAGNAQLQLRAWSNLVEFEQRAGDTRAAIDYANLWFQNVSGVPAEEPRRGWVHYNLGLVHRSRRDPEQALSHFRLALRFLPAHPVRFRLSALQMTAWQLYEVQEITEGNRWAAEAEALVREGADLPTELVREQLLLMAWRDYRLGNHRTCIEMCQEFLAGPATNLQKFWAGMMISSCGIQLYPDDGQLLLQLKASTIFYAECTSKAAIDMQEPRLMNYANELRMRVKARWSDYLAG